LTTKSQNETGLVGFVVGSAPQGQFASFELPTVEAAVLSGSKPYRGSYFSQNILYTHKIVKTIDPEHNPSKRYSNSSWKL